MGLLVLGAQRIGDLFVHARAAHHLFQGLERRHGSTAAPPKAFVRFTLCARAHDAQTPQKGPHGQTLKQKRNEHDTEGHGYECATMWKILGERENQNHGERAAQPPGHHHAPAWKICTGLHSLHKGRVLVVQSKRRALKEHPKPRRHPRENALPRRTSAPQAEVHPLGFSDVALERRADGSRELDIIYHDVAFEVVAPRQRVEVVAADRHEMVVQDCGLRVKHPRPIGIDLDPIQNQTFDDVTRRKGGEPNVPRLWND